MTLPQRPRRLVLVVDDEEDVRDFVSLLLEDAGYAVEEAVDGQEALQKMATSHPDLVVLDLMMPGMDGWDVLGRLRHTVHPPVVVILSAYADCPRALKAGAAGCLLKPFVPAELLETCRRVLAVGGPQRRGS